MKIPKQAKKVFSGEIFDVYQWHQKMFDGSIGTFEMLKRPDTVQIIATRDNKIFITKQKQPGSNYFCSLLGGRVNKKEKPLSAAKRELLEESGFVSSDWELIIVDQPYGKIDWKIYTYVARNCQKIKKQKLDNGEKIFVKSVNFNQFIKMVTSPSFISPPFRGKDLTLWLLRLQSQGKNKINNLKKIIFEK